MSVERLDRLPFWLGRGVAIAAGLDLALWFVAPQLLGDLLRTPTKPTTALAFALVGVILGWRLRPVARWVLAGVVAALAAEGLVSNLLGRPLVSGRYELEAWHDVGARTGQMAQSSALVLLSLLTAITVVRHRPWAVTALGGSAFGLAFLSLVGHVYGAERLTTLQTATEMVRPTVPVALACALAVLLQRPDLPAARALRSPGTAGTLVRRYVGVALFGPPLAGWLLVQGERVGWFDAAYGQALMALITCTGAFVAVVTGARVAARAEHSRVAAEDRERLQFLLDGTSVGIFEASADGRRRYANRRLQQLSGMPDDTDSDSDAAIVLHAGDAERVNAEWAAVVADGSDYSSRYRFVRPDGTVVWVDTTASALRGADGAVARWLGSVTDVTGLVDAAQRLEASERRYRSVVETMAEGVILYGAEGTVQAVNDAAVDLLGVPRDQLVGRQAGTGGSGQVMQLLREDGSEMPVDDQPQMRAAASGLPVRGVTTGLRRRDGSVAWLVVNSQPLYEHTSEGRTQITGVVTTFTDVTAARSATRALARSEEQFRSAMAHAPVGMALVDLDGRFIEVNRSLCRLLGYDEKSLVGNTFQQITHPEDLETDLTLLAKLRDGEIDHYTMEKRYLTRTGGITWVQLAVSMTRDLDDRPAYYIAQVQDITAARAEQERLEHQALHDPLTGLANRDLLMDRLAHALARSTRTGQSTVVLFADLDFFKEVNDSMGHEAGDLVLVAVADRLRAVVRPSDTVARLGGDEFVVVAEDLTDPVGMRGLAERVRNALEGPLHVAGREVQLGSSLGVVASTAEDDARSLLRAADAAMYRAKARGRGRYELGRDELAGTSGA
ncbi:MAG TPA: PAS domain S-box protein [Actinomycetes bacterium]|jgi:diguanylate cyclase (GGDEF)-like protein/PAS domain S-box-containing protein